MSVSQLEAIYLLPRRDDNGYPVFDSPRGRLMSPRELFVYRCSLLGIRDPDTVADLWNEQIAASATADRPKRKRRRR